MESLVYARAPVIPSGGRAVASCRTGLRYISPLAWAHPADRAALRALRMIPGFDDVVRYIVGGVGERGVRLIFQANAVRVGPTQLGRVDALFGDVLHALDAPVRPDLFVSQAPAMSPGTYGLHQPFIVLHSSMLDLADDELAFILGHEVGQVLSGHAVYKTLLAMATHVRLGSLPPIAQLARLPLRFALVEWQRKSKLSGDRAGLLACQNPDAALRTFLRLASGARMEDLDLDAFLEQVRQYRCGAAGWVERFFRLVHGSGVPQPFHTLRAAELDGWLQNGGYHRILSGDYPRRDAIVLRPVVDESVTVDGPVSETAPVSGNVLAIARRAARTVAEAIWKKRAA